MDYLFFDIECADGHRICSFGYVLTDASFTIKQKADLLINPRCPFRLGRAGLTSIELAYSQSEFYNSPDFAARYDFIAALMSVNDRIIFGHSVASDITFLADACIKYNKKRLKFDAYDTQAIFSKHDPEHKIRSLDGIMKELGADTSALTEHKSCDDAEMTMLTAKLLCEKLGIGIDELIASSADCVVNYKSIELMHLKSAVKKTIKTCNKSHAGKPVRNTLYISDTVVSKDAELRRELVRIAYRRGYAFTVDAIGADVIATNGALTTAESARIDAGAEKISLQKLSELLRIKINGRGEPLVSLKRFYALHKKDDKKSESKSKAKI